MSQMLTLDHTKTIKTIRKLNENLADDTRSEDELLKEYQTRIQESMDYFDNQPEQNKSAHIMPRAIANVAVTYTQELINDPAKRDTIKVMVDKLQTYADQNREYVLINNETGAVMDSSKETIRDVISDYKAGLSKAYDDQLKKGQRQNEPELGA